MRKSMSLLLCLLMLLSLLPTAAFADGEGEAAALTDVPTKAASGVLPNEIGLTQQSGGMCTLVSSAMMLRARMYRSDNRDWPMVTENSIKPVAWDVHGCLGYRWTYTINGNSMSVSHAECSGMTVAQLKQLLDAHPEGIVFYVRSVPHAVFLCDYVGDTFYCFEPANSIYSGRRPLSDSWLGDTLGSQARILSAASDYWYVSSYSIVAGGAGQYPVAYLESASGGPGTITLQGWAFDWDDVAASVPINVYVGGKPGSGASCYAFEANALRGDVDAAYPGVGERHGFSATISVGERGTQTLYVYACDPGGNLPACLVSTATVTIGEPLSSPVGAAYTGLACSQTAGWRYYENGAVNTAYAGLAYSDQIGWWYVENGTIRYDYTGVAFGPGAGWCYCTNGAVDYGFTGLACSPQVGWLFFDHGVVSYGKTGFVCSPQIGWWYVNGGAIDFSCEGLVFDPSLGWWYVQGGRITFDYTGLVCSPQVGWWYVTNSQLCWDYTGVAYRADIGWWYCVDSAIAYDYTGMVNSGGATWNVVNGRAEEYIWL